MVTPQFPQPPVGRGIGSSAGWYVGNTTGTSMDLASVVNKSLVTPYSIVSRRLASTETPNDEPHDLTGLKFEVLEVGQGLPTATPRRLSTSLPDWRSSVFTFATQYTYTASGVVCGCDVNPTSVCDACGVCGGANRTVDCAGSCFGAAAVDACGVCAGGTTGNVANADMDCDGVCFGNNTDCELPPNCALSAAGFSVHLWSLLFMVCVVGCLLMSCLQRPALSPVLPASS